MYPFSQKSLMTATLWDSSGRSCIVWQLRTMEVLSWCFSMFSTNTTEMVRRLQPCLYKLKYNLGSYSKPLQRSMWCPFAAHLLVVALLNLSTVVKTKLSSFGLNGFLACSGTEFGSLHLSVSPIMSEWLNGTVCPCWHRFEGLLWTLSLCAFFFHNFHKKCQEPSKGKKIRLSNFLHYWTTSKWVWSAGESLREGFLWRAFGHKDRFLSVD